jgi:fused signal recognition particle receptor
MNIFAKFKNGLKKSSSFLSSNIINSIKSNKISQDILDEIESVLISADIGLEVTEHLIKKIKATNITSSTNINLILELLASEINTIVKNCEKPFIEKNNIKLQILMFVGVNGSGKTTSIGKLTNKLGNTSKILVAACDTFRAAAVDQLKAWSEKDNVEFFQGALNQDPASIAFKACNKAIDEKYNYLIIDTAGRLSNNTNLVNQLVKIKSVIQKITSELHIKNILVLDGTNGSNMINQVETFAKAIEVSGLIITKLDGTAKGGAIISIAKKYQTPIYFVGLGEKKDDLQEFDAKKFSYSLLGLNL